MKTPYSHLCNLIPRMHPGVCAGSLTVPAAGIPTFEERMDDIRAVMDAAGSDRAVIYGLSEGVPLSILFAATYPERTQGLMLYGGSATYVTQSDYPWQKTLAEWQRVIAEHEATLSETWGTIESAAHGCATLRRRLSTTTRRSNGSQNSPGFQRAPVL